jgi:hypothetical protein
MDPLATAYLKVIEEETSSGVVDSTKSQVGKTFGDKESEKKAHETFPKHSTEKVEGEMEDVEEAPEELTSDGATGELEKVKAESSNPFDVLYNKIINEEMFDFSTEDNSLEPSAKMGSDESLEEFDDESDENESNEVTVTLDREMAQKLHDVLMAVLGMESEEESEEEDEEMEDMMDSEEEEEDDEVKEAVEAEYHGHALVDQEKLEKGMTKHSNMEVKGAVPVSKKKAEVVKGKKADGKPEKCTDNPEELTSKSKVDTGGVRVGKSLFDQ